MKVRISQWKITFFDEDIQVLNDKLHLSVKTYFLNENIFFTETLQIPNEKYIFQIFFNAVKWPALICAAVHTFSVRFFGNLF